MKIKRVKTDEQNNVIVDQTTGQPVIEEVEMFTQDEVSARNKSSYDKQKAAEKAAEDARKERERLEAQLAERDTRDRERERQALPPDQQVQARMSDLERENAATRAQLAQFQTAAQHQVRQISLVAYRERAVREVPPEVADLVGGSSEEEIDASVDAANRAYTEMEKKIAARFQQGTQHQGQPVHLQQPTLHTPPSAPQYTPGYHVGQPAMYQPPPNPAYVPPVHPQVMAQGGFPTPTNPVQMPDPSPDQAADLSSMTTEAAVRSGRYGGEVRERIHAQLKGQIRYPGALGSAPRHWSSGQPPQGHVAQPGGVMQPQGFPMGPVQPPGMPYQQPPQVQPQYAPQPMPAPQGGDPRGAAQEAIARMHAGNNPVMGENVGAAGVLQASHAHAHARGIQNTQQAFAARFTPTPPIQQQPNGQN